MREADADLAGGRARLVFDLIGELLGEESPHQPALNADSAVVQIVDLIMTQSVRDGASHVHIEPQADRLRIRFRIGRTLRDVQVLPIQLSRPIASWLKIMANMALVDGHPAQDGQTSITADGVRLDIEITTSDTIWGEKVVVRLLDSPRSTAREPRGGESHSLSPRQPSPRAKQLV